jgi:hypothetical protein
MSLAQNQTMTEKGRIPHFAFGVKCAQWERFGNRWDFLNLEDLWRLGHG